MFAGRPGRRIRTVNCLQRGAGLCACYIRAALILVAYWTQTRAARSDVWKDGGASAEPPLVARRASPQRSWSVYGTRYGSLPSVPPPAWVSRIVPSSSDAMPRPHRKPWRARAMGPGRVLPFSTSPALQGLRLEGDSNTGQAGFGKMAPAAEENGLEKEDTHRRHSPPWAVAASQASGPRACSVLRRKIENAATRGILRLWQNVTLVASRRHGIWNRQSSGLREALDRMRGHWRRPCFRGLLWQRRASGRHMSSS